MIFITLFIRMLEHGANVNIADVHNTTPIMDIIGLGDESRALSSLTMLMKSSRNFIAYPRVFFRTSLEGAAVVVIGVSRAYTPLSMLCYAMVFRCPFQATGTCRP